MNCQVCNKELKPAAKFCPYCGTKVEQQTVGAESASAQPFSQAADIPADVSEPVNIKASVSENPAAANASAKGKKGKGKLIAISLACVLVVAVLAGGVVYYMHTQHISSEIERLDSLITSFCRLETDYALGNMEEEYKRLLTQARLQLEEKEIDDIDLIEEQMDSLSEKVIAMNEEIAKYRQAYDDFVAHQDNYISTDADRAECNSILTQYHDALYCFDVEESEFYYNSLKNYEDYLQDKSSQLLTQVQEEINSFDREYLFSVENSMLNNIISQAQELCRNEQYPEAYDKYNEGIELIRQANVSAGYTMILEQVDETNYPDTKLYLKVTDFTTGEIVDYLDVSCFQLWEQDADNNYQQLPISFSSLMDGYENLNIGIVADVSASMGYDLAIAEDAMSDLVNNMQFSIGDKAALYSFADTVQREQYYTDNYNDLNSAIYNLEMGNMTALYDGLAFSLSEIIVQDGAKCIIAFTDGMENYSISSKEYVIEKAKQYGIPIYIIGIGSNLDSWELQDICNSTGGFYTNISNISEMSSLYQNIYREQKSRYVLEYTTSETLSAGDYRNIFIRYNDGVNVIRHETAYRPENYTISGFIFHDSDSRYLTVDELNRLTEAEVRIALNEIYARRGYIFQTAEDMMAHFNRLDWYNGTITDMNQIYSQFNEYEQANVELLVNYEIVNALNGRVK